MRSSLFPALALALGVYCARAGTNPVQIAAQARFDLLGDTDTGSLTNGYVLEGDDPQVSRQAWITNTDQPRSYTVSFNIVHYAWTEAAFTFTPAGSGTVTLTLSGPWGKSPDGTLYRQEVLWDACSAVNATLTNGGFETLNGDVPAGWTKPYGDAEVATGPVPAVDGTHYARLWQDGPLSTTLSVTGGLPVTLHFFARAGLPPDFIELKPIAGTNTPAHQTARMFRHGVNLSDCLEVPPGHQWGVHYTTNDFSEIRRQGFDHVRVPIGWNFYTGPAPDYVLSDEIFSRADFLITNSLNQGLAVLLNIHGFDDFSKDPYGNANKFYAIWRQVAAHYSNSPPQVAFELINEPTDAATTTLLNPIYAEVIRQIRRSNPSRTIFVGPGKWDGITELGNLRLPDSDSNLVVTVHCYNPMYFTHQGANWPGPDFATTGVRFPGPPPVPLAPAPGLKPYMTNRFASYNTTPTAGNWSSPLAFRSTLKMARQWSDYYGRPIYVGEFGCYVKADPVSRANFYREFRSTLDTLGLGWAMWDWKSGFRYWDEKNGRPAPGLHDAMFPPR